MITISLRFEEDMKNELDAMCEEMGMNLTTFFMIYAKKVLRDRRIPFDIVAPSDNNQKSNPDRRYEMPKSDRYNNSVKYRSRCDDETNKFKYSSKYDDKTNKIKRSCKNNDEYDYYEDDYIDQDYDSYCDLDCDSIYDNNYDNACDNNYTGKTNESACNNVPCYEESNGGNNQNVSDHSVKTGKKRVRKTSLSPPDLKGD